VKKEKEERTQSERTANKDKAGKRYPETNRGKEENLYGGLAGCISFLPEQFIYLRRKGAVTEEGKT